MAKKPSTFPDTTSRPKILPSECKICHAPALYSYYGAITCYACKIFFKRNAQNCETLLKCDLDDKCQIDINNRNICPSCRLAKCFQNGMKIELIRSSIAKKRIPQPTTFLPTLNILPKDKFLLNQNQWNIISNLSHSYDQSNLLSIIQSQSLEMFNEEVLQKFISLFYETAAICLRNNEDLINLPSDDRSVLISTALDNVVCLGGVYVSYHSQLFHNETFMTYAEMIYGTNIIEYYRWSAKFTESDPTVFQLAIALSMFSINSRTFQQNISKEFNNLNSILDIENKYAEVIWKYLIYASNYEQAVKTFMNLIQWFLAITTFISFADNNQVHFNDIQSTIEQIELALVLDDVDQIIQKNN